MARLAQPPRGVTPSADYGFGGKREVILHRERYGVKTYEQNAAAACGARAFGVTALIQKQKRRKKLGYCTGHRSPFTVHRSPFT